MPSEVAPTDVAPAGNDGGSGPPPRQWATKEEDQMSPLGALPWIKPLFRHCLKEKENQRGPGYRPVMW